ncbi:hypothetical protein [Algicella marina]|uniref:DUF4350 domain-containing protein n=1 Tax=Algicella marina TaxID=2683284 RepID=A0A6P1SVV1_9RHOB|nr:hypothetical protein [Algicella marina]QHQ33887.1 hypothetical protein GO499_01165 [Algicella marina]
MSHVSAQPLRSGNSGANIALILLAVLVIGGFGWLLTRDGEQPLARSPMGFAGLVHWAKLQGSDVQNLEGVGMEANRVGLRILPLFDTDLETFFEPPEDRAAYLRTGTEFNISLYIVREKVEIVPSLVIAPKWTRGARHSGYAHASLLLEVADNARPFEQLGFGQDMLTRPDMKLAQLPGTLPEGQRHTATIYAPQLFRRDLPQACSPVFDTPFGALLITCQENGTDTLLLSDPDLLNNHGLGLGGNAALVADFLGPYVAEGTVLVDMTTAQRIFPERPELPRREWSDLLRFFEYPLSLFWAALALAVALGLWRSWRRLGPPARPFNDDIGASKSVSIAAKARLMRAADRKAHVFEAYVQSRLRWLDHRLHGHHGHSEDLLRRLVQQVKNKDPDLARSFGAAAAAAMSGQSDTSATALVAISDRFEAEIEKVLYEFGRTSRTS